ncbi:MAG: hypothetical protein CL911_04740 [Deltaproteobacteria bacterium]|nr:hypothetical protein [Deltaproteobacteria bacterium]
MDLWESIFLGGILGLVVGSFVNLALERLPLMWGRAANQQCRQDENLGERLCQHLREGTLSLAHPARSFCFSCGHQLRWWENIPVFSFLCQHGRCRKCGQGYGTRTLVVEAGHGGVYALLWGVIPELAWALWISFSFSFWGSLGYLTASGVLPPVGKRPILAMLALIHLGAGVLLHIRWQNF